MTLEQEKHIVTISRLLGAQVCSTGTYDEALEYIRTYNPAGTQNNWQKNGDGPFAPVQCASFPDRTHYMFNC